MPKSTPIFVEWKREFSSQGGMIQVFDIEFEDGTVGEFTTKKRQQTKFEVGTEVNYTMEEKSFNGSTYLKIDVKKEESTGGHGGYTGARTQKSPEIEASIVASVCLECACVVVEKMGKTSVVKNDLKALHGIADKYFNYIISKSAGNNQLSINYQSRLKQVVNNMLSWPELKIENSDDILKYVEIEVAYLQSKMTTAKK